MFRRGVGLQSPVSRAFASGRSRKGRERERASHNEPPENGLDMIHCFVAWRLKPPCCSSECGREKGIRLQFRSSVMTKVRLAWLFTARYIYILGCRRKFAAADRPPRQDLKKECGRWGLPVVIPVSLPASNLNHQGFYKNRAILSAASLCLQ